MIATTSERKTIKLLPNKSVTIPIETINNFNGLRLFNPSIVNVYVSINDSVSSTRFDKLVGRESSEIITYPSTIKYITLMNIESISNVFVEIIFFNSMFFPETILERRFPLINTYKIDIASGQTANEKIILSNQDFYLHSISVWDEGGAFGTWYKISLYDDIKLVDGFYINDYTPKIYSIPFLIRKRGRFIDNIEQAHSIIIRYSS